MSRASSDEDWEHTRMMPFLNEELKATTKYVSTYPLFSGWVFFRLLGLKLAAKAGELLRFLSAFFVITVA